MNMLVFGNAELLVQRMKKNFVYNLWSWSKVFVDMDPSSLVSFIDWLGSKRGQMVFFVSFSPTLGGWCILLVYFRTIFWCFLYIYIYTLLPIKKKEKKKEHIML